MASPQRDVELVIRARDEATKALGTITDALNALVDTQTKVGESATGTGTNFDKLSTAIASLNQQVEGLKGLGVAVAQMDKAGEAIERLEQSSAAAGERLEGTRKSYTDLGEAIEGLQQRAAGIKDSLAAEQVAFKETQVAANALDVVINKLGESLPRNATAAKKLVAATEEQKQAYREARDQMFAYLEQQTALEGKMAAQSTTITNLNRELKTVTAELNASDKAYGNLANQVDRQAALQEQATTRVAEAKAAYGEMQVAAERAAGVLGNVALNTEAIATASKSASETVRQLNAELAKQPTQTGAAAGSTTPRQELIAAKDAVRDAEGAWRQAEAAIAALNAEIRAGNGPTQEQAAKMLLAREAAVQAKGAYEQSVAALSEVRTRVREVIAASQEQREAMIRAAEAARVLAEAERASAAMASLDWAAHQEEEPLLERLRNGWRMLAQAVREDITAQAEATRAVKESSAANEAAGASLGNLKAQVAGLASAYFGLIGAVQAIQSVIETYRTLEQAQAQLVASNNGNEKAAAADMEFLRGRAEQYGLSLKDLTEQYGKLSVASAQNNVSAKTTRELFDAVSQSARVVGLDSERTSNVLYGFVRMIDFGKVSARDFRSVLTLIPGAQRAMDEALDQTTGKLGVTTEEFRKMEKSAAGIPVTDALLRAWAENMQKQMGERLPYALHTFNAEWGRFQTNWQESQDLVGKSGFMDALAFQLQRLNTFMKSDEGQKYFQEIGHSLGALVNILGEFVAHITLVKTALEVMLSIKVAQYFASAIPAVINLAKDFSALRVAIGEFAAGTAAAEETIAAVGGAASALVPVFAAVTFIALKLFSDSATGVTALDDALDKHERYIQRVRDAYSEAGGKVSEFREKLDGLNDKQLNSGKLDLEREIKSAMSGMKDTAFDTSVTNMWDAIGRAGLANKAKVEQITKALGDGKISAQQYRDELLKMHDADAGFASSNLYKTLSETIDKVIKAQDGVKDYDAALKMVHGTSKDLEQGAKQLNLALGEFGNGLPTDKVKAFNDALLAIKKNIPELARAAEAETKLNTATESLQSAIGAANGDMGKIAEAMSLYQREVQNISGSAAIENAQQGNSANYLHTARQYIGMDERNNRGALESLFGAAGAGNRIDPEKAAWCAAFVNAVLAKNGIAGTGSLAASSFAKFGSEVKADKAEPGDIVIIKGKGGQIDHVGFMEGLNADGSVRVLGGNQGGARHNGGAVTETTFPASSIAGFRRKTPMENATEAQNAMTSQAEFNAEVKAEVSKFHADAAAISKSARDLAIAVALDSKDREVAEHNAKDPAHPITFSKAQRQAVATAAGQAYDAHEQDAEKKKLAEIQHQWNEILHAAEKVSAEERARLDLIAKGFKFTKDGKPADAVSAQAMKVQIKIETDKDMRQGSQEIIGKFNQLNQAKVSLHNAYKEGDSAQIKQDTAEIKRLNAEIQKGLPQLIAYFKAMGDQKAVAELSKVERGLKDIRTGLFDDRELTKEMAQGLTQTLGAFAEGLAGAIKGTNSLGGAFGKALDAFRNFAAQFLIKIAEMIIQAQILKLLMNSGAGSFLSGLLNPLAGAGGGGAAGASAAVLHTGGVVGSEGASRSISPSVFATAVRYHTGGIAGLKPNEVGAVLERGEEVLNESSPRHIKNIGKSIEKAAAQKQDIKVVNAIDAGHMMSEALGTSQGQRSIVNFIRTNARAVNSALKG